MELSLNDAVAYFFRISFAMFRNISILESDERRWAWAENVGVDCAGCDDGGWETEPMLLDGDAEDAALPLASISSMAETCRTRALPFAKVRLTVLEVRM